MPASASIALLVMALVASVASIQTPMNRFSYKLGPIVIETENLSGSVGELLAEEARFFGSMSESLQRIAASSDCDPYHATKLSVANNLIVSIRDTRRQILEASTKSSQLTTTERITRAVKEAFSGANSNLVDLIKLSEDTYKYPFICPDFRRILIHTRDIANYLRTKNEIKFVRKLQERT